MQRLQIAGAVCLTRRAPPNEGDFLVSRYYENFFVGCHFAIPLNGWVARQGVI
jgi:hypothetical protein